MHFIIRTQIHTFTPKISVVLADMAEAGMFTATYLPSRSKHSCCNCLVTNEDLNNMSLSSMVLQTPEEMRRIIDAVRAKEFSIHEEINFFWNFK